MERELILGDDEDYYFGTVGNLAVRDDGRMYVPDAEAWHVKLLNPNGTLRDSIGRAGEGPGEVPQPPRRVMLSRGDSLYVVTRYRVSVFAPDHDFVRRFEVRIGPGPPRYFSVPEQRPDYVALETAPITYGQSNLPRRAIQRIDVTGEAQDTLAIVPPRPVYIHQSSNGMRVYGVPFSPSVVLALGPEDRVHLAWGDSLSVGVYDVDGVRKRTVSVPFEPVPVAEADRKRVLKDMETGPARTGLRRQIPSTKPAFEHFLVDDEGRYWFGRPTSTADSTDWWVADPAEKRVVTARLPSKVQLMTVKDGRAYGRTTTEGGAPALVRYEVEFPD